MALPSLAKTWQFSPNVAITATGTALGTNRLILKTFIDRLTSTSGWVDNTNTSTTPSNMATVKYSCDSVVAGTAGDGVNRWDSVTDLVWAITGTAHSWIVLKFPGISSSCELLIACENTAATGQFLNILFSPISGFTGGSTTARPTAPDEIIVVNATTWGGVNTTDANVKLHFLKSSDGECWRFFCANGGQVNTSFFIEKPVAFSTNWTSPSVCYWVGSSAAISTLTNSFLNTSSLFFGKGSGSMQMSLSIPHYAGNYANVLTTTANDISGNWPFIPTQLWSNTVGNKGCHGYLNDAWLGSTTTTTGSTSPTTGTQHQFVQLGSLIVPWCQAAFQSA